MELKEAVWRYKYHIAITVGTVLVVLLISAFTGVFEKIGGELLQTVLGILSVCILLAIVIQMQTMTGKINDTLNENGLKLDKIANTLERSRAGLTNISQGTHLTETVKAIAFGNANRQALREAVFEMLQAHDFDGAAELIDEIASIPEYAEMARQLHNQAQSYRTATDQERVGQLSDHIQKLIDDQQWPKASAQIEKMLRAYPDSQRAKQMRQKLIEKKGERKRILLAAWDDAVKRQDTDRSLEILRELDAYLTPAEALALQEAASDVFRTKLHNMGVQFSLAVSSKEWAQALEVGRQIIREFPNSKMATEIRTKLNVLTHNARSGEPSA